MHPPNMRDGRAAGRAARRLRPTCRNAGEDLCPSGHARAWMDAMVGHESIAPQTLVFGAPKPKLRPAKRLGSSSFSRRGGALLRRKLSPYRLQRTRRVNLSGKA